MGKRPGLAHSALICSSLADGCVIWYLYFSNQNQAMEMPYWGRGLGEARVLRLSLPTSCSGCPNNERQRWGGGLPEPSGHCLPTSAHHPHNPHPALVCQSRLSNPLPEAVDGGPGRAAGQTTSAETPRMGESGRLRWGQGTRWRSQISEDLAEHCSSRRCGPTSSGQGWDPPQNKPGQRSTPQTPPSRPPPWTKLESGCIDLIYLSLAALSYAAHRKFGSRIPKLFWNHLGSHRSQPLVFLRITQTPEC